MFRLPPMDFKSFVLSMLLFNFAAAFGVYSMYRMDVSFFVQTRNVSEAMHNTITAQAVTVDLQTLFSDLRIAANHLEVRSFLDNPTPANRASVESEFANLCAISGAYDQVRLLDTSGDELIRVNSNSGKPAAVPRDALQNKGNRYYFIEAMKLRPGAVYVSPFDLNIENGRVERPFKPMLRVCMPIVARDGTRDAVIILNYLGQRILDDIVRRNPPNMEVALLNEDGYWLLSADKDQEWGFMLDDRRDVSFASAHPETWSMIRESDQGQFMRPEGEYTFRTIELAPGGTVKVVSNPRRWKLVHFMPKSTVDAGISPLRTQYLGLFFGLFLFILFGAMTRARYKYSRVKYTNMLEEARKEADAANAAKSDFLARMSHEIRTPMNAVIGLTHLALKTELSPKQTDYLRKISSSANSLLGIINDVLDYSKIEANRITIERTDFRLDDVLDNIINMLGLQAEQKGLEFYLMVDSGVPNLLIGDPMRLGQVVLNLVGNAIKFTESGQALLTIETEEEQEGQVALRFLVQDSGIGISQDKIDKLFQPFSQADDSTTREFGGTGLGLAICKRLVEMMGGTLEVASEPGTGSTFTFLIPFQLPSGIAKEAHFPDTIKDLRVLVVDDSSMSRIVLKKTLESFSLEVVTAGHAREALDLLRENDRANPFDLVITDWRMPEISGTELIRMVKQKKALRNPPKTILITAYGHEEAQHKVSEIKADGLILKPFSRSFLFDTIMEIFAPDDYLQQSSRQASAAPSQPLTTCCGRLLLAEDNEINQQVAKEILEDAGFSVVIVNNGREAVEMVRRETFDAVLMDIQMPVMDGLEATRIIRSEDRFKDLPIIAMTAHALIGDREKSLQSGLTEHVTKPIDPDQLIKVLVHLLPEEPKQQPSPGQTDAAEPTVPSIPTINTEKGLARVRGNYTLYRKLLVGFVKKGRPDREQLDTHLSRGEWNEAATLAHSMKGAAGNLGAEVLFRLLSDMETAIKDKHRIPEELMEEFDLELARMEDAILPWAPETPEPEPEQRTINAQELEKLRPQLLDLAELMRLHDVSALKSYKIIKPHLDNVAPGESHKLDKALDAFNYSEAQRICSLLLQQCQSEEVSDG